MGTEDGKAQEESIDGNDDGKRIKRLLWELKTVNA
jgi:hypothetical protein